MRKLSWLIAILGGCGVASATFVADFESPAYNGSAAGTLLQGQQGWYTPVTTPVTNPSNVHTYAGNSLGVATNPFGGNQFVGSICGPAGELGRSQHDVDFSTPNTWFFQFDRLATFAAAGPAVANNLGGFSLQNSSTNRGFNDTFLWIDVLNPSLGYNNRMNAFDAAGVATNGLIIGAAWDNQVPNRWYRDRIVVDFGTNLIMQISVTDLTTNITTTVNPTGWYMLGGANYTQPRATAIRLFTGGGAGATPNGNIMAWDNLSIVPEPATLLGLALGIGALARLRKRQ